MVLVAQWVVGNWVEERIGDAIRDGSMYGAFQRVGDMIWDMLGKDGDKDGSADGSGNHPAFEASPDENGGHSGGDGRYQ